MIKPFLIALLSCITLVNILALPTQSQADHDSAYQSVPQAKRASLQQSVARMVELQKQQRWAEIYDLLPDSERGRSRDDFVRESSQLSRLLAFEPTEVVLVPTDPNEWLVIGCGAFAKRYVTPGVQSGIYARFHDTKWSVSTVMIVGGEGVPPKRCTVHTDRGGL
jgi:hypothetical protein